MRGIHVAVACALVGAIPGHSTAQDTSFCDEGVAARASGAQPYRVRGDRCEGTYTNEVATSLFLRSLYVSFEDFDPSASGRVPLQVEWIAPDEAPVRLQAEAIRQRLYYQMDAVSPAGETTFIWGTEVLEDLDMRRRDLGVLAWVDEDTPTPRDRIYLPVNIWQTSRSESCGTPTMVLYAGVAPEEVFVTITELDGDGAPGAVLRDHVELGDGYYPAGRPLRIRLPELTERGAFSVQVSATLRQGGDWAQTYTVLNSPSEACSR